MIAFIALTMLAIALLPAWSPDLRIGAVLARAFTHLTTTVHDMNYAARRMRELQTDWSDSVQGDDATARQMPR